jgi:hypothetical protein
MTDGLSQPVAKTPLGLYLLPLVCCIAASVVAIVAIRIILAIGPFDVPKSTDWAASAVALAIPSCLIAVFLLVRRKHFPSLSITLQLLFAAGFLAAFSNIVGNFVHLIPYGDYGYLDRVIGRNDVFPRWFLGSAILTRLYQSLWPTIGPHLPAPLGNPDGFIRLVGAALMSCSSIVLLRWHGARLRLIIPLLSPIWLLFHSGYNEYYPFIAWGYMCLLFMLTDSQEKYTPRFIATVCAALCLSYAGFVPIALFVLTYYALSTDMRRGVIALLMAGVICVFLLILLWPNTLMSFAHEYVYTLNLGEQGTGFSAYIGQSGWGTTPFFSLSYALSVEHLSHLGFMFFLGIGPVPLLSVLGLMLFYSRDGLFPCIPRTLTTVCLGAFVIWQVLYGLLMIPKLGPLRDVDLFFSVYLTIGFIAGLLGDKLLDAARPDVASRWTECIVAASLGSSAVILTQLLYIGFR